MSAFRAYEYLYIFLQLLLGITTHQAFSLSLDLPWEIVAPVSALFIVGQMLCKSAADELEHAKDT